jgi:uncharacterized membrane protein (DUF4010 family)
MYWISAIAGSTDVDAIVLSIAEMGQSDSATGLMLARSLLIAALANTLVKFSLAAFLGSPTLRKTLLVPTAMLVASCALAIAVVR